MRVLTRSFAASTSARLRGPWPSGPTATCGWSPRPPDAGPSPRCPYSRVLPGCRTRACMDVDTRLGTRIAGYHIESLLGRGGMSVVYLAEHVRLGRKVALKILSSDLARDTRFRERFVRESRIAAGLEHPNVIPVYEADEVDGVLFIAMRLVRGTDLKSLLRSGGALEPARTIRL